MGKEINWNAAWQKQWQPFLVGERWYLAPPWGRKPTPAGRIRLNLHEGNHFGNGDHATTRMILAAMETRLRPGRHFVDVGCGSGLLCIAANMLGAGSVAGCDLDEGAIRAAKKRFRQGLYCAGSTENFPDASADVAAANLALGVLEQIEPDLRRILRTGGTLLTSGVLEEQREAAARVFAVRRWSRLEERASDGWIALILEKRKCG